MHRDSTPENYQSVSRILSLFFVSSCAFHFLINLPSFSFSIGVAFTRDDWILRRQQSSSFRVPRNLSHSVIRQARTGDTVLVKSREMTGSTQTLPWWLWGEGEKTTENKLRWPRCLFLYFIYTYTVSILGRLWLQYCNYSVVYFFLALLAVSSHSPLFDCFFDGPAFCFFQIITVYDETTTQRASTGKRPPNSQLCFTCSFCAAFTLSSPVYEWEAKAKRLFSQFMRCATLVVHICIRL